MKANKHIFDDRDLSTQLKWPTLSWSMINSWNYATTGQYASEKRKEEWYNTYVLGKKIPENTAMKIGVEVGAKLISDPKFLPKVVRYDTMEKELRGKLGKIDLIGHIDSFDSKTKYFNEYKTSLSKEKWNQKIAENHGQLLFYYLLIYLNFRVKPEQIKSHLYFIHCKETGNFGYTVKNEDVQVFSVKKTLKDILIFGVFIGKIYKEMEDYVKITFTR